MFDKSIKKIGFLTIILLLSSFALHKYYVSVTEIVYKPEAMKLEIVMRVFPDDMEHVLSDTYQVDAHLGESKTQALLKRYVHKKFKLRTNETDLSYNILGTTQEDDFLVILMEAPLKHKLKSLAVYNAILQDLFDEQKNIVHFMNGTLKKSFILEKAHNEVNIDVQN